MTLDHHTEEKEEQLLAEVDGVGVWGEHFASPSVLFSERGRI